MSHDFKPVIILIPISPVTHKFRVACLIDDLTQFIVQTSNVNDESYNLREVRVKIGLQ